MIFKKDCINECDTNIYAETYKLAWRCIQMAIHAKKGKKRDTLGEKMENPGIEPSTSRTLSERSTK